MNDNPTRGCGLWLLIAACLLVAAVLLGIMLAHPADAAPGLWRVLATEEVPTTDPFTVTAREALAGKWGPLPPWKAHAYRLGLRQGVTASRRVWLTAYYPWEGHDGRVDARGNPCTLRTVAANVLPYGSYLWTADPCGMRQVLDRGAARNDRIAKRRGCNFWADLWMTREMGTHTTRAAVIREPQEAPRD